MIPINFDTKKLHKLFMEGISISEIALEMEAAESEIHYTLSQLRKKDPEMWPKRKLGYIRKTETPKAEPEAPKEKVKIEASFPRILPPSGKVNNDVITRAMTDEERARVFGSKQNITNQDGILRKPPIAAVNRPIIDNKETIELKTELTRELYLSEKAAGKGNAQIERDYGLKPNSLYPLIKKWEHTGAKTTPLKDTSNETGLLALNASREAEQPEPSAAANLALENQLALSRFKDAEAAALERLLQPAPAPAANDKLTAIFNYVRDLVGADPRSAIFDQIAAERDRQDRLHPLPDGFPLELRMEILIEEVGEVAKAKLEGNLPDLRKELIEVAAVAVRWVEMLDREAI